MCYGNRGRCVGGEGEMKEEGVIIAIHVDCLASLHRRRAMQMSDMWSELLAASFARFDIKLANVGF